MTRWELYLKYVHKLDDVLWDMGMVHGIKIDNEARLKLQKLLTRRVSHYKSWASRHAPMCIRPVKRYKNFPSTDLPIEHVKVIKPVKTCTRCGAFPVTKTGHVVKKGGKNGVPLNECRGAEIALVDQQVEEYDVRLPFNPLSTDQLKAYALHHHHPLAVNIETGLKTKLDDDQITKLIKRFGKNHPIYSLVKAGKKVNTTKTRYVDSWIPDERGYLYGRFQHSPETFRLAQQEHNFMNVSHRGDVPYATELRRCIIPSSGCRLIEADSSSVEAVMTGWYMGSESYMNIARKGVHAYAACKELGIPFTDANRKMIKNTAKYAMLYARKKRITHGVSYGMGANLLAQNYPDIFPSKRAAQLEIDGFLELLPELAAWHDRLRKEAWKNGCLTSPWGITNYYYQVYSKDIKTGKFKLGPDAKSVIAFLPQHSNGMFQRETLLMLGDSWVRPYMCAIGHCHDSAGLDVPLDKVDDAVLLLKEVMTRPIKEMDGLTIGVDVKVGKNWADMEVVE